MCKYLIIMHIFKEKGCFNMKKVLFSKTFLLYIIISVCIGYFIGHDIKHDFLNLYVGKMTLLPFRYMLLTLIILVSNFISTIFLNSTMIVRKKSFFNFFFSILKYESLIFLLIYTGINIPVCILNFHSFFNNLCNIVLITLNSIIISFIISFVIILIDMKFKNRVLSSCIFLVFFALIDFVLEHFNFYIFANNIFDFSYIFILPILYNNYIIIAIAMIIMFCLLISLIINLSYRKDYFLRNDIK